MTVDNALETIQHEAISGFDGSLPIDDSIKNIMELVDTVSRKAIEADDPHIATDALKHLLGVSRISGLAAAKFFYVLKFQWENFSISKQMSAEKFIEEELAYHKLTIKRYYQVYDMLVSGDIPTTYQERIESNPIKSLIPIGELKAQGYEIENSHWSQFANAENDKAIREICREIKGKKPRKNQLNLEWDAENKTIIAWKDSKPHSIYLQFDETDEVLQQAMERILKSSGMLEK